MDACGARGRAAALAGLALVLVALALAWRDVLELPLTGEDFALLAHARDGVSPYPHLFRPLSGGAVRALHAVLGPDARALHAASLALHAVCALLVYAVGVALLRSRPAALAGALAFAVGAGACDALAWLAAINRPLSGIGQLVALLGLVHWRARPRLGGALIAAGLAWQGLANEEVYGTALLAAGWLAWCAVAPRVERRVAAARAGRARAARAPGCGAEDGADFAGAAGACGPAGCAPAVERGATGAQAAPALHDARWAAGRDTSHDAGGAASALAALGVLLFALAHYALLQRVPGGAGAAIGAGLGALPRFALARSEDVMRGLGAGVGWLPALLCAPLALAGRPQAALLVLGAWAASFVPFALEHPVEYRAYPTLAPAALSIAACVRGLALSVDTRPWTGRVLAALAALSCLLGAAGPRARRLATWHAATREVAAVDALARARAWSPPDAVPALVNLDTTTAAAVAYRLGVPVDALAMVDFLDAAGGYVPPRDPPPRPWIGRRADGGFGEIDPATYFARPALPEVRLAGRALAARDLADARRLLADPGLDGGASVVVEGDPAAFAGRSAAGEVVVLEPFAADPVALTARMRVAARAPEPTILVVDCALQFSHAMRIAADQMLFSDVAEARVLRLEARIAGAPEPQRAVFADALGFALPLPAGEHVIDLAWRRATPEELR